MELWEFNACFRAYNRKLKNTGKEQLAISWQTAAFTGAAFAGKLRKLKHYLAKINDRQSNNTGPQISKKEFEQKLKLLEERRAANGT